MKGRGRPNDPHGLLFTFPPVANAIAGMNIFLRITVSLALCLFLYLFLTVSLFRSLKPATQFLSMFRDMWPGRAARN